MKISLPQNLKLREMLQPHKQRQIFSVIWFDSICQLICLCFFDLKFSILSFFCNSHNPKILVANTESSKKYFRSIGNTFLFHIRFMRGCKAIKYGGPLKVHVTCTYEHTQIKRDAERQRGTAQMKIQRNMFMAFFLSPSPCMVCVRLCVFFRTFFVYTLHACEKKIQPYQRDFDLRVQCACGEKKVVS